MYKQYPLMQYQWDIVNNPKKKKLHLACGDSYLEKFTNVDLYDTHADVKDDVCTLKLFRKDSIDLILASHILEHISRNDIFFVLRRWLYILKPGGTLIIEFPDMLKMSKKFLIGTVQDRINLNIQILGDSSKPGHRHEILLWRDFVMGMCYQIGCSKIFEPPDDSRPMIDIRDITTRLDIIK